MIEGNPQMQELLERNPELRSMMRDPEFIQQSMEAMRNPSMMREMMRNTDRAMSNIESLPGGSAALHRLYNEVQAPLMDATAGGPFDSSKDIKIVDSKQLRAKYGDTMKPSRPVSEPMLNPWAPRSIPTMSTPAAPRLPQNAAMPPIDMSAMAQMMQNPMMQQLLANPMGTGSNGRPPNPLNQASVFGEMFNPSTMQAMSQLETSLGMMGGQSTGGANFNSLFGNFINTPCSMDPQVRYRTQLATLRSMGFEDTQASIRALDRTSGNVDRAVDILILERSNSAGPSSNSSSK
jgi:ubiquilin